MAIDTVREAQVPLGGKLGCMFVSLVGLALISICTLRRVQGIKITKDLPPSFYLVIAFYGSSFLFVFVGAVYRDAGINASDYRCEGAILICLILYMVSKLCIYLFLVERAHIVRASRIPRMKDRLYLVNTFGMLFPFTAIFIINVYYRSSYINNDGVCMLGIDRRALIPLISFDVAVNAYLTVLFLVPLHRRYYSSEDKPITLRNLGLRAFIGSLLTLIATAGNLLARVLLDDEPGWVCFMSCNLDVLFAVCVIHWVTKTDDNTVRLSPYQRRLSQVGPAWKQPQLQPQRPWFKPQYASQTRQSWPGRKDDNDNGSNDRYNAKGSSAHTSVRLKEQPSFDSTLCSPVAQGTLAIEMDTITVVPTTRREAELDVELQRCCRGDTWDTVSSRGILEDCPKDFA
ncbi:ring finger domain protein [Diplodia corticola]|uniref:Ring finger domain protein n=1 Tax=Diplodia corticola TaxID=236234 RepID=A0A1J9R1R8_9PEZI|nr:ring finger domain protein [Diplodia corticola]OJD34194.1 ring finger domain protein [Diplodia corticola]